MAYINYIQKCGARRCCTCPYIEECSFFSSNSTGARFRPKGAGQNILTCKSENIIYMIFCKICNIQYIGETKNRLHQRFNGHRSGIKGKKSGQIIHKHFEEGGHGLSNCRILPIEIIDVRSINQQNLNHSQRANAISKLRLEREKFWISTLQTAYPFGLNSRVKGIGDFNPSQGQFQSFGGRSRRKNKKHSRRKPKRLRNKFEISLDFINKKHQELVNKDNYIHFFKTFLYGLPKVQIQKLSVDAKQSNTINDRVRDLINMVSYQRLFKPVQVTTVKNKNFYHIRFRDKGLDHINVSQILRNNKVQDKIPVYFMDKEPPIIGYKFNRSIAGKIFNYKQSLSEESIELFDNDNIPCHCQNSVFKDINHGHIITGDLNLIENGTLRNIFRKGPKYRLPQKINWKEDRMLILNFLENYIDKWISKERKNGNVQVNKDNLNDWKNQILEIVDHKINTGKKMYKKSWSQKFEGVLARELENVKKKFVITVTDKAQNNILFTCKYFYIKTIKEELMRPGQSTYQQTHKNIEEINLEIENFSKTKGIKITERMKDIPLIYWIPKMHKNPIGSRFIAGSKFCSIKILSKCFSKALKLILNHLKLYCKTVLERTGLNYFWILENSLEFLEKLKLQKIDHMETYDFSTLYTALPHREIKQKFSTIFQKVFNREAKPFINVNLNGAYFSSVGVSNRCSFRINDMMEILEFILDNIYVKCGKDIFKQIVGIPIGLDSGQDIANLLLYSYESEFVEKISRDNLALAHKFKFNGRYIDDLFVANFPTFKEYIYKIYPRDLEIKLESSNTKEVAYLDLKINSENSNLTFSIYDKRDDFSFDIVNFPFMDSCIPKKSALGVFFSQLIRYARISTKFSDFKIRGISLISKLKNQGFMVKDLRKLGLRFFKDKQELLTKYNLSNANDFIKDIFT